MKVVEKIQYDVPSQQISLCSGCDTQSAPRKTVDCMLSWPGKD